MSDQSGEKPNFEDIDFSLHGDPVDRVTTSAEIRESAAEEPMVLLIVDDLGRTVELGTRRIVSDPEAGGQPIVSRTERSYPSYLSGAVALSTLFRPLPSEIGISAFKEGAALAPGEAAVYEFIIKSGVIPADITDAVSKILSKPEEQ